MDYRGLSWNSASYSRIRGCLEMVLNIIEYRGLSWISTSSHCIRDCLEMLLNRMGYRGLSWNSVDSDIISPHPGEPASAPLWTLVWSQKRSVGTDCSEMSSAWLLRASGGLLSDGVQVEEF